MARFDTFPEDFGSSGPEFELPVFDPIVGKKVRKDSGAADPESPMALDWPDQYPRPIYHDEFDTDDAQNL
jgi:hypothetical protein